LVGETFSGDSNLIKSYVDPCNLLDGQFDFPLRASLGAAVLQRSAPLSDLESFMNANTGLYGAGVMSTFVGNADVPRAIHFAEDTPLWSDIWADGKDRNFSNQPAAPSGSNAYQRLSVAFAVLFTNRGVPLLYYGDEVGQAGAGDPDNRRFMQWSGYSIAQTELQTRIEKLGAFRAAHTALRRGDRTTLSVTADTWAYQMVDGGDRVVVVLNRSDATQSVSGLPSGSFTDAVSGQGFSGPSVTVPPRSFLLLQ
jgi:glycosidase